MTTDESIMTEMLDRATNPDGEAVDELGVQMFCMIVRSNTSLVQQALKLIAAKIRSTNVTEATKAIALLEECATKCGSELQDELAKFRFLNELIFLVSKTYHGKETPVPVKQRIMECLLLLTTKLPQKNKIREAYDALKKEEGVEPVSTAVALPKRESILGKDENELAKLIHSGDPENYRRANMLIQHRVNQEARRIELVSQHKSMLNEMENTVGLLNQMLDTFVADGCNKSAADASETVNIMRELYMACKKHKPILQRMPELFESSDGSLIADTFEASDMLLAVMKRYKDSVVHSAGAATTDTSPTANKTESANTNAQLLADLLGDLTIEKNIPVAKNPIIIAPATLESVNLTTATTEPTALLASEVTLTATTTTTTAAGTATNASSAAAITSNVLDELTDIFGEIKNTATTTTIASATTEALPNRNFFENLELLEPVSIFDETATAAESKKNDVNSTPKGKRALRELREIDKLSEELFKKNLAQTERVGTFKREPERMTLNDLAKDKISVKSLVIMTPETSPETTPEKITKTLTETEESVENNATKQEDDQMLVTNSDEQSTDAPSTATVATVSDQGSSRSVTTTTVSEKQPEIAQAVLQTTEAVKTEFKHLSDITVDLDNVTPTDEEHLLMEDDDVKIALNFAAERPCKNVSIVVMSVANKSKMPVKDFQFEASVKKPCKVRLLPPTDTAMPAHKPFRPPAQINQIILLFNPTGKAVDVTCIVGYKLGDDPDPIKESIVAKNIPFVE